MDRIDHWRNPSQDKELWKGVNTGIWESLKDDWKADTQVKTDEARVLRLMPYRSESVGVLRGY